MRIFFFLIKKNYIDKAIMEEETEGSRDSNKSLANLLPDNALYDFFDIGACLAVKVLLKLGRCGIWE